MTSLRFLLFLLLHQVYSEEVEPVFKAKGSTIEMGYCFGVDYLLVYRSAPVGDQLLGNSSADDTPITPPADLQGRISINKQQHLLGLQISGLTHMDSGIYRRECWQNQTVVSQHTQQLSVCNEEIESKEISVKDKNGGAELLCNSSSIGLEGTSVRWYYEMYPTYKLTLLLDSSVSLNPLVSELQGVVEARASGALLLLDNSMLKNNQQFYCLVIKGKDCRSFQSMYLPDHSETRDMFATQGDRVVLRCPFDGDNMQWETPLGRINSSSVKDDQMYISFGKDSEEFSLVIPAVSENHSGDYSCISSSLEIQYLLVLCPKKESQKKDIFIGENILLECDVAIDDSQRVLWHRLDPSGEYELILDSKDKTVPIPQDLAGKLTMAENGSSLKISHLEKGDQGVYSCVVLKDPQFLEDGDEYEGGYDEEDTGEDEFSVDQYWHDRQRCILKQETILSFIKKTRSGSNLNTGVTRSTVTVTGVDPSADSSVTLYAVLGILLSLLVVGVIIVVIVIKKRRAASRSGLNNTNNIAMNVDPGCTESLTHNNECGV